MSVDWLAQCINEVKCQSGCANLFVLPYPYASGHFRIKPICDWTPKGYTRSEKKGFQFLTIGDERLAYIVRGALALSIPAVCPAQGPLHTLVAQLLACRCVEAPLEPPERLLLRLAIELTAQGRANKRYALAQLEPLLDRAYARALCEGLVSQALKAIACQTAICLSQFENNAALQNV